MTDYNIEIKGMGTRGDIYELLIKLLTYVQHDDELGIELDKVYEDSSSCFAVTIEEKAE